MSTTTTTTTPTLPPISTLPSLPPQSHLTILDLLFEPSPALHTLALPLLQTTQFESYTALIDTIATHLTTLLLSPSPADLETLTAILSSHPRLGATKVDSAQSAAEQAQLQAGKADEKKMLETLNAEYEGRFGGLVYVVFVNGRSRDVVMQDMRRRIDRGDVEAERVEALKAMCDIAKDRAGKLLG